MKKTNLRSIEANVPQPKLQLASAKYLTLKGNPDFNEAWLQGVIAQDPSILDLGDLVLLQRERPQPRAGRLDLLFKDEELNRRYTFELQLGVVDESHIIRAIEYWDNEKRRYPEIDHCAVICAETINTRFLNVISLFNRQIPLIALQVRAIQIEDKVVVTFTKVLDEVPRRNIEEEIEVTQNTDRSTWELKVGKDNLQLLDKLASSIEIKTSPFKLTYVKPYIGCSVEGRAANFLVFKPTKSGHLRIDSKLRLSKDQIDKLESADIEVLPYAPYWKVHPIKLSKEQVENPPPEFFDWVKDAYNYYFDVAIE
jgi:hypothetical protein